MIYVFVISNVKLSLKQDFLIQKSEDARDFLKYDRKEN